jgi:putative spermidine/putrescine transport system permease protein
MSAPALLLFACMLLVPLGLTTVLSFHVFDHATGVKDGYTTAHYLAVVTDEYYHGIFWRTFWISGLTTLLCLAIGAPEAYILSRMSNPWRSICLLVVLAPLLVSVVVRAFGWSMLLGPQGVINHALQAIGLGPVRILDPWVENAALSLNASPFTALRRIVLPQVVPGLLSGSLLVFGLSASAFAIPGLLGGRRLKMVATVVYDEYLHELNWPLGGAIALVLLLANLVVMLSYNRLFERRYKIAMG